MTVKCNLGISIQQEGGKPYTVVLPGLEQSVVESTVNHLRDMGSAAGAFTFTSEGKKKDESKKTQKQQEADMSGNITKAELEALLRANKSEVDVVAAEMKKDIAEFKSFQAQQFATLNSTLGDIKGQVASNNAELTAVKGQIDGMKTSYASIQWMVGAILMVLALILALPQIQSYLKSSEQPVSVQVQQPAPAVQATPSQAQPAPQPVPQEPTPEPQKAPATKQ